MRRVECLQHLNGRVAVDPQSETPRSLSDARRLVPERLQKTEDAIAVFGRAEEDRGDETLGELARQIRENAILRRLDIGKELLHEFVVIIGELLEHGEARFLLEISHVRRYVNDFARHILAIDVGPLEREIDEARDAVAAPDRD